MSDPLYRRDLLRLAADAHGAGRLVDADATGEAFNPACGDRVGVTLMLAAGRIADIAHETRACVLAQASASILGRELRGVDRASLQRLHADVAAMLQTGTRAASPLLDAYRVFDGAGDFPSRHRCVLLPIEAVLNALDACKEAGVSIEG
jgi:nitrogen fixation NifU-like protein